MTVVARSDNHNGLALVAPSNDDAIARLAEWAQAADAAYQVAQKLVTTQFVPKQYFNKPEEATAAILAGAELGFNPMAALRAFDNISGTPAPKAITLRAVVQGVGHDIRIDESTPERAVVSGRRKGDSAWQTSTWTLQRAADAGYVSKNPNYKTKSAEMLIARATSEVCRWIASDAIMGMPYSAEEIRDEDGAFEPRPRPSRVTAAEIIAAADELQPEATTTSVDTPVAAAAATSERESMTRAQQSKLHALFNDVDVTDRPSRLQYVNEVLAEAYGPERQVTSSSELSKDEASQVIDKLQKWADNLQPTAEEIADVVGDVR
jgi:hypothetical protein